MDEHHGVPVMSATTGGSGRGDQRYFDDVRPGDEVEPLEVEVTPAQLFFFSAATSNGHRIHYDRTWATEVEGHPDVVVPGPLQIALAVRAVTDWAGGGGRLLSYSFQSRGSAYGGDTLRFTAHVTGRRDEGGQGVVDLDVTGEKDGRVLLPGCVTVALPRRPVSPLCISVCGQNLTLSPLAFRRRHWRSRGLHG
jgi:acyl dehydratase